MNQLKQKAMYVALALLIAVVNVSYAAPENDGRGANAAIGASPGALEAFRPAGGIALVAQSCDGGAQKAVYVATAQRGATHPEKGCAAKSAGAQQTAVKAPTTGL
jgi:hypothetical protein